MALIDLILNLVGLVLWVNWRAVSVRVPAQAAGISLLQTLKAPETRTEPRLASLVVLVALILGRTFIYWHLGSAVDWRPRIEFGPVFLTFRSEFPGRMFFFSVLSFTITLFVFYASLLMLSALSPKGSESDSIHRLVSLHLGWVARLPWFVKVLLPGIAATLFWAGANPMLTRFSYIPPVASNSLLWQQALVVGFGAYLAWQFVLLGLLALHVVNTYVYLGNHPFWIYINQTSTRILRPLEWLPLRLGKMDFGPILAIAAVIAIARFGPMGLSLLYRRLPF